MLADRGYPIHTISIGDRSAEEVAASVAALITERVNSSRAAQKDGSSRP